MEARKKELDSQLAQAEENAAAEIKRAQQEAEKQLARAVDEAKKVAELEEQSILQEARKRADEILKNLPDKRTVRKQVESVLFSEFGED